MATPLERPPRMPMWVAGVSLCLLATAGVFAIAWSIPPSHGGMPDEATASLDGAAPGGDDVTDVRAPSARLTATEDRNNRRNRASCSECGVVKSMRQIEDASDGAGQDVAPATIGGSDSAGTIAANARTGQRYEITVRFRDGSTTVLNAASPGTWRVDGRVIVIGRLTAPDS